MITRLGAIGCAYKEMTCDQACWEPNTLDICTQTWRETFLTRIEPMPPTAILPGRIDRRYSDSDDHLSECLSGECKTCLVAFFIRSNPKMAFSDA